MTPPPPQKRFPIGTWIRFLVLSLLFGIAAVVLILRTEKQEAELTIVATFNHLSDNLMIVDSNRQIVMVSVSATKSTIAGLDPKTVSCQVGLADVGVGIHTIAIQPADIVLPQGVSLMELLTPSLTLRVEAVSQKTVAVIAALEGKQAAGFAVVSAKLNPDHVLLKGTAAMLSGIDTVNTQPINLENTSESFKKEVPLNLPESIVVDHPSRIVVAEIQIEERMITRVLENIPVFGKGTSRNHEIRPDTITLTISGPEAIVNTVETDPAFAIHVDLSGINLGTHTLKASINLPVRTTLIRVVPERFTVTIRK